MTDTPKPPPDDRDNRRNHYRVLHVQPEAPLEVIKASYRTLMTRLKMHPDLGGSHAQAAMINQAWQVLSDPERRAAYDRMMRLRGLLPPRQRSAGGFEPLRPKRSDGGAAAGRASAGAPPAGAARGAGAGARAGSSAGTGPRPGAAAGSSRGAGAGGGSGSGPSRSAGPGAGPHAGPGASPGPAPERAAGARPGAQAGGAAGPGSGSATAGSAAAAASPGAQGAPSPGRSPTPPVGAEPEATASGHHCPLCGQLSLADPRPDSHCLRCDAPLAALPEPGTLGHELLGRRAAMRRPQDHVATLRIGWPSPELPVRWRDLSLTGLSFYAPQPLAPGQRIRLNDAALDAVAVVVASRPQGRMHSVHARLLSARLLQATGVFCSESA